VVVEADNIDDLRHKQRVGGQLEPIGAMRLSSTFRQIRPIVDGESPDRCAIEVLDQWVAPSVSPLAWR
jgi:hypothetical protein